MVEPHAPCFAQPASQAHLEELRDRLAAAQGAAHGPAEAEPDPARLERLVSMVRAMDAGLLTSGQVLDAFSRHRVPSFSFGRWLVDMVDEGVYLEAVLDEAT